MHCSSCLVSVESNIEKVGRLVGVKVQQAECAWDKGRSQPELFRTPCDRPAAVAVMPVQSRPLVICLTYSRELANKWPSRCG